jgi:hypothetical protein
VRALPADGHSRCAGVVWGMGARLRTVVRSKYGSHAGDPPITEVAAVASPRKHLLPDKHHRSAKLARSNAWGGSERTAIHPRLNPGGAGRLSPADAKKGTARSLTAQARSRHPRNAYAFRNSPYTTTSAAPVAHRRVSVPSRPLVAGSCRARFRPGGLQAPIQGRASKQFALRC